MNEPRQPASNLDAAAIQALAEEWVRIAEERGATPLDLMKALERIVDVVEGLTRS